MKKNIQKAKQHWRQVAQVFTTGSNDCFLWRVRKETGFEQVL